MSEREWSLLPPIDKAAAEQIYRRLVTWTGFAAHPSLTQEEHERCAPPARIYLKNGLELLKLADSNVAEQHIRWAINLLVHAYEQLYGELAGRETESP